MESLAPVFVPYALRGLNLPNRIVMAPMTRGFSPNGVPGADVAAYYRRRAEGGVGLIITEGVGVDHPAALGGSGVDGDNAPHMYGARALAGWKHVVEEVHAAGGVIIPQLWHQGVMREKGTGPHPEAESMRPSGVWGPTDRTATVSPDFMRAVATPTAPMSDSDIADVIAGFARSAANAMALGFDGIAIHGAHGYLLDTFFWDETNQRADRWGGDRRARTAFAVAMIEAIRAAIGAAPVLIFRFSQWKQQDVRARLAPTPQALEDLLAPLADAGADIFDASQRYFDRAEYEGADLNLAGWAKKVTGKPSMTVGGIGLGGGVYDSQRLGRIAASFNVPKAAERLARGEFDLIGVGRSLLHDPYWVRKLRNGEAFDDYNEKSREVLT
ncbi:MAG: NADH:flavin oxidoreductase [Hyphomonadaceae bacterium]